MSMIYKDNKDTVEALKKLRDENGKPPFKPNVWCLIEMVARFPRENGCWMSLESIREEMGGRITVRTIRSNFRYLHAIGVVSKFCSKHNGKGRSIRRLKVPGCTTVESVSAYRIRTNQYPKKQEKDNALWEDNLSPMEDKKPDSLWEENFSSTIKNFEPMGENFSSMEDPKPDALWEEKLSSDGGKIFLHTPEKFSSEYRMGNIEYKYGKTPYIPPFEIPEECDMEKQVADGRPSVAKRVGCADPNSIADAIDVSGGKTLSEQNEEKAMEINLDILDEPDEAPCGSVVPSTIKKSQPKTQRARRQEALDLHNGGHIANPLGRPDNSPRCLRWKKARDIGPEGAVTVSQLYRHLVVKYWDAVGVSVEDQLPRDRYAVKAWFDRLRQSFLDLCGYDPSYRELAEYFDWLLNPGRFKNPQKIEAFKVQQIQGKIYVKQFYDRHLFKKDKQQVSSCNPAVIRGMEILEEMNKIYGIFEKFIDNKLAFVDYMARYGIVLPVQLLYERSGLSEGQCRKRIIELMAYYLRTATDREAAMEMLTLAFKATERFEHIYDSSFIWQDWRVKCEGLLEEAKRQADDVKEKIPED